MGGCSVCLWGGGLCVYGVVFPVSVGRCSLCLWGVVACIYAVAVAISMGGLCYVCMGWHSLYVRGDVAFIYRRMLSVYMRWCLLCL